MDENTRFIIERIDKVAEDIFDRLSKAMAEHKQDDAEKHLDIDKRVKVLEEAYFKTLGGAFVVGGVASWVIKKLGG